MNLNYNPWKIKFSSSCPLSLSLSLFIKVTDCGLTKLSVPKASMSLRVIQTDGFFTNERKCSVKWKRWINAITINNKGFIKRKILSVETFF